MGFTDVTERRLMRMLFARETWTIPQYYYAGLLTRLPTDDASATEVTSGGGHTRQLITGWGFGTDQGAYFAQHTNTSMTFGPATQPWGTIVGVGIYDAPNSGLLIAYAPAELPKTVDIGERYVILQHGIRFTLE